MTFVRFNRSFEHKDPKSGHRTRYPSGWSGEVEGAIEDAASKAGALLVAPLDTPQGRLDTSASDAPVNPGVTPAPNADDQTDGDDGDGLDDEQDDGDDGDEDPSHAGPGVMTKAELQEEAERRGLAVPSGATKADIVALLTA